MKRKIFVVFCVFLLLLLSITFVQAETDLFRILDDMYITDTIEIWHYSGGYWKNESNGMMVKDKEIGNNLNVLMEKLGSEPATFTFKMSQELMNKAREETAKGNMVRNALMTTNPEEIKLQDYFNFDVDISHWNGGSGIGNRWYNYTVNEDTGETTIELHPKFHFYKVNMVSEERILTYRQFPHLKDTVLSIPLVHPDFGSNDYSLFGKNGVNVNAGHAKGYLIEGDIFAEGNIPDAAEGRILPTQIKDIYGNLESGFKIRFADKRYDNKDYDSEDLTIGKGTFSDGGAVSLQFDYKLYYCVYVVEADQIDSFSKMSAIDFPMFSTGNTNLVLNSISAPSDLQSEQGFSVVCSVTNESSNSYDNVQLQLDNGEDIVETTFSIGANETKDVTVNLTAIENPLSSPIDMPLIGEVNPRQSIQEENYDDNIKSVSVSVQGSAINVDGVYQSKGYIGWWDEFNYTVEWYEQERRSKTTIDPVTGEKKVSYYWTSPKRKTATRTYYMWNTAQMRYLKQNYNGSYKDNSWIPHKMPYNREIEVIAPWDTSASMRNINSLRAGYPISIKANSILNVNGAWQNLDIGFIRDSIYTYWFSDFKRTPTKINLPSTNSDVSGGKLGEVDYDETYTDTTGKTIRNQGLRSAYSSSSFKRTAEKVISGHIYKYSVTYSNQWEFPVRQGRRDILTDNREPDGNYIIGAKSGFSIKTSEGEVVMLIPINHYGDSLPMQINGSYHDDTYF
ncbi:MAG: hypothetical protein ACOX7R_05470 [Acetivibrionales bacterium]